MVTPAGKELLKNTINNVKLHNRILEENEMWKQWHLEKALTMMVSDDFLGVDESLPDLLKKKKKKRHKEKHKRHRSKSHKSCHSSKEDHVKSKNSSSDKWDHSGFEELYPDSKPVLKNGSSELKSKSIKDFKKQCKPCVSSSSSSSSHSESSDSKEIWEEFKSFKKRRREDFSGGEGVSKPGKSNGDIERSYSNKHKRDEATLWKKEHFKKCERHCHHKHERKSRYDSCGNS